MIDDSTLLQRYARDRSEEAFAEIVRRHLTLVYSAALRRTDGDAHRAQDVAQIVFTALARDAAALSRHAALTGWFYAATRNAAIDILRAERRRRRREEEAHTMEKISSSQPAPADWEQLRPVLDDVMDELDERDREAVLLRFFEGRPLAAVGAVLRVSEDAARKRVDRALDKLGALLARRGITSTGGALAVLLANQTAVAAPAGVAAAITASALAGASAGGVSAPGILIMSTSKAVTGITAVVALVAIGSAVYQADAARDSAKALVAVTTEKDDLQKRLAAAEDRTRQSVSALDVAQKQLAERRPATPPAAATPPPASPVDYILDHPETHAAFVEQQVLRARARYEGFLKAAGLSAGQQEAFFQQIREWSGGELDFMLALRSQGYGVGSLPQDPQVRAGLQKLATEKKQSFESGMRGVLGDDGYRQFQQYGATIPERNVVDQLGGQLYRSDTPLTPSQADQLVQVLVQNRFSGQPAPAPTTTLNGTFLTRQAYGGAFGQAMRQSGLTMLDWRAPVTDAALDQAAAVLAPGQIAALRQVQAQQVVQFQIAQPPPAPPAPRNAAVK